MEELQVFKSDEFGDIRVININGKELFVASDIAKSLGYVIPSKAVNTHCKGVSKMEVPTNGGKQEMLLIPEGDIYRLIVKSKLPNAEKFESWVFDEVLPIIRKTGGYVSNDEMFLDTYFPFIDESAKAVFKQTLETVRKQNKIIQNQKKEIEAKNSEIIHKKEVITGLVEDIDIYTKIAIVNRIIKRCVGKTGSYGNRYNEMYKCFKEMFHIDLSARCEGYNMKQQKKKDHLSIIKYAEKFNHMDNLYMVACKLYETEVNDLLEELKVK